MMSWTLRDKSLTTSAGLTPLSRMDEGVVAFLSLKMRFSVREVGSEDGNVERNQQAA
jgi:hypothetical protein